MSKLHDEKYQKWDKLANELDTQTTLEEEADKKEASAALGHSNQPWSEAEAKEKEKAERAKLAKKALDKQRELEEVRVRSRATRRGVGASIMARMRSIHLILPVCNEPLGGQAVRRGCPPLKDRCVLSRW